MADLVHVVTPDGVPGTVPADQLHFMPPGTKVTGGAPSEDSGGLLGGIAAGVLGAGSAATLGLTDRALREGSYVLGGPDLSHEVTSNLQAVRERNRGAEMAGEFGGLLLNPEALSSIGEAAAAPVAARAGEGLLASAATSSARLAAESVAMGAQKQITEDALGDHEYNGQAVFSNAAKDGLIGAAVGAPFGIAGNLLGKAARATGLLARRPGPLADAALDDLAETPGAGRSIEANASRAEKTVAELRASGATSDQASDMVSGLEDAAKASSKAGIGSEVIDDGVKSYIDMVAGKNPERRALLEQHYADSMKPLEGGVSETERAALDMRKTGNSVLRNIEDTANDAQFAMRNERFAKLVDPTKLDAQMDQANSFLQNLDGSLSFWETTAGKGGGEGAIKTIRKLHTDVSDLIHDYKMNPSESLGRDINVRLNRLKRGLDRYVPYGRAPGALIDGKAIRFGVPEFVSHPEHGIEMLANGLRSGLEDESVWGPAGAAQARENASFSQMKARFDHFMGQVGERIDQAQGVKIPEVDFAKTKSMLEKVTGNPEVDEALQPVISARATINGFRDRIAALREGGELTASQVSKLEKGEQDLTAFESSLNGAMAKAAKANRLQQAVLEEHGSGVGGLLGLGLDTYSRPLKTIQRMAGVQQTVSKVEGGVRGAIRKWADAGGSSTEGRAARAGTPRPKADSIKEMETIRQIAGSPAALEAAAARMTGDLGKYAPRTADAVRLSALRALIYLAREAPPASVSTLGTIGTPKARYSDVQIHEWETKRNAALDPHKVVDDMAHGKLDRDAVQAAKYVAPQLFEMMQQQARDEIANLEKAGKLDSMPYQQKAVIASLLEVHADRTFEPDFIAMMQAAQQKPQTPAPKRGGGGSSAPAQPPGWLQTEAQRIEGGI